MMLMSAIALTPVMVDTAKADTSDVTTRWIVPADTTIVISFPNGQSIIEFNAVEQNFSGLGATAQTVSLSALRVKNNGNTPVQIEGNWTSAFPTNVTHVNMSIGDWTNSSSLDYTTANCQTKQTWVASLETGESEDFWFWTSGEMVEETGGEDRTLRIHSSNA